jgi:hypothetical protein
MKAQIEANAGNQLRNQLRLDDGLLSFDLSRLQVSSGQAARFRAADRSVSGTQSELPNAWPVKRQ